MLADKEQRRREYADRRDKIKQFFEKVQQHPSLQRRAPPEETLAKIPCEPHGKLSNMLKRVEQKKQNDPSNVNGMSYAADMVSRSGNQKMIASLDEEIGDIQGKLKVLEDPNQRNSEQFKNELKVVLTLLVARMNELSPNQIPQSNSSVTLMNTFKSEKNLQLNAEAGGSAGSQEGVPKQSNEPNYKKADPFWIKHDVLVSAKWYHIWALSCGIILGALYFRWNTGLIAGFGSFCVATALTGVAYVCLTYCLSEMASTLPFSGGSYGFARAMIGKPHGMFVGLCESLEYIFVTVVNVLTFCQVCTSLFGTSSSLEPLWGFLTYAFSMCFHIYGGLVLWNFVLFITVLDVLILLLYAFGCLQYTNFALNAGNPDPTINGWFLGGIYQFMAVLPLAIWCYKGIEALPLASAETHESKKAVPQGMVRSIYTVIVVTFMMLFICCAMPSNPNNSLLVSNFPLAAGFELLFHNPGYGSPLLSLVLVPGVFASCFGFMFCYGRQMFAMSRSGLLPAYLSLTVRGRGTPYAALLTGSALGYLFCLCGQLFVSDFAAYQNLMYNCFLLVAIINYEYQLVCYIILKYRYPMLTRKYVSPVGATGALIGLVIFFLSFVAVLGWTEDIWIAVGVVTFLLGFGMAYYYLYASKHLVLSSEEQCSMLMVYTVNFVRDKQKTMRKAEAYVPDTERRFSILRPARPQQTPAVFVEPRLISLQRSRRTSTVNELW